jgi:hypothetical protein
MLSAPGQPPVKRVLAGPLHDSEELMRELRLAAALAARFKLTPAQSRVLAKLLGSGHASRTELHAAIAKDGKPTSNIGIVNAVVSYLRKRLRGYDVEISTLSGIGYAIAEADRARIRAMLEDNVSAATDNIA